ncbi:MAG: regulatory signaling modulator protein AmpE [Legionella sp.]
MKLLIIILCLLSERFLVHALSAQRFVWFSDYCQYIKNKIGAHAQFSNPWIFLAALVVPVIAVTLIIYVLTYGILFGFIGFLVSLFIFYYCLGPQNVFYPTAEAEVESSDLSVSEQYLAAANSQLFAVIFWFIIGGPITVLVYRLIHLLRYVSPVMVQAEQLSNLLEWIPARITSLLYLLVGHFQPGFATFTHYILAEPQRNNQLISECGVRAIQSHEAGELPLSVAETLVEHATVVLLVLIALFTLVAWL